MLFSRLVLLFAFHSDHAAIRCKCHAYLFLFVVILKHKVQNNKKNNFTCQYLCSIAALHRNVTKFIIHILNIIMFIMTTGCEMDGQFYPEGEMVQGVAQSPCENCFCMKGRIQCLTIECTPLPSGCSPILTSGKCCPSSYNCSEYILHVMLL